MKQIFIFLLAFIGVAHAQFAPTSAKTKFVNGISIGSKDSTYFTNAGDTIVLYIGRDSAVYARYKGYHRKLAYFDQVDTTQIFQKVVRTFGDQTVGGKKTFSDTIVTQKELRINNGVGNIKVGEELIEASSTGLVSGGNLTKASSTTYSIAAGEGHVINNVTKRYKSVSWSSSTNRTPSISNVQLHVLVDSSGNFVEQSTPPTRAQRRSFIYLGYISQVGTTVNAATPSSQVISQPVNQSYDFFDAYGPFNVSGNTLSANGANLRLNKTAGEVFKAGSNFQTNPNDPNVSATAAATPLTFKYATQTLPETNGRLDIDPTKYDVAGTATTIAGSSNQATIQRVWLFPSDTIRIQYGQTVYSSLSNALSALQAGTDVFTPNPRYPGQAELLGYIVVTKGATALNDLTNARVLMNVLATTGTAVAGSTYWGDILGSLNNQGDLRDTLAQRVNLTTNQTIGGSKTFTSDLTVNGARIGRRAARNLVFGDGNLPSITSGLANIAIGDSALLLNTTGNTNTAVGLFALSSNTTGGGNVAVGSQPLQFNSTGIYNIGIGEQSFIYNETGSRNIALGVFAGSAHNSGVNSTSNKSIYIGGFTKALGNNQTNQIVIGDSAVGNGSNTVTIGNSSVTDNYLQGNTRTPRLLVSDSGIVRKLITSNTTYPSSLDTNKSFYWRVRDEVWMTDMPGAPNSGIAGLHIAKTDNSTNNPIGITWSTGSNNFKWDIGLDFENDDFVLGYNHDSAFRGDFIRVSKTNRVNFGNGVGTPKFNPYKYKFVTTAADSTGIGGIQISTTSTSDTALFVDGVLKGRNAKFAAMVQTDDVIQAGTPNGKAQIRTYFNNGDIAQFVNSAFSSSTTNYGFMQRNDGATFIGTTGLDVNNSVTATSLIKSGGTSTQALIADGSVHTLTSGTYTPTLTNTQNISSSSATSSTWTRIGNIVTVYTTASATTSAAGQAELTFSLPVATTSANATATGSGIDSIRFPVTTGSTGTTVGVRWTATSGTATTIYVTFQYTVN